jgi:anti-sigma28 factor (negative regulator of flagellin synthesis)
MHINKIGADSIRADALQRAQGSTAPQGPVDPVAPTRGADAVQLSDAGLALASDAKAKQPVSSLDPSRVEQIRSSILSGAYNSLEMADQIARAVIRSGDL